MAKIAGIDGCHNGWFVISHDTDKGDFKPNIVVEFKEVLELCHDFEVITVDMPIGLLSYASKGGRTCDKIARKLLKPPRASSVFSPPVRQALVAETYDEANQINKDSSPEKLGIPKQCYGIFKKLKEIDDFMNSEFQGTIKEIHPELCFYEMNKNKVAAAHKKSTQEGFDERLKLLQHERFANLNIKNIQKEIKNKSEQNKCEVKKDDIDVKRDDILDAYAALWTAKRIFEGKAIRIPTDHVRDSHRLLMEMWR